MRKMPPCRRNGIPCDKRYPGCQDHCKEFAEWKDGENERNRKRNEAREEMEDAYSPRKIKAMIRNTMRKR